MGMSWTCATHAELLRESIGYRVLQQNVISFLQAGCWTFLSRTSHDSRDGIQGAFMPVPLAWEVSGLYKAYGVPLEEERTFLRSLMPGEIRIKRTYQLYVMKRRI